MTVRSMVPALALALAACGAHEPPGVRPRAYAPITPEEIAAADATNLYTVIQYARPNWLRAPLVAEFATPQEVAVYYGRTRMGGPEALHRMATGDAFRVSFVRPAQAQMRYGNGHVHGAIVVEPSVQ